ncbi:GMC family oxidoreductase [Candidatus Poriferisocius sp.]|uniref:GMC family oxidoreductase n=1 Tax=Candidatus Poriferisocius sp. TaxID=3101276 RepID=UPI003B016A7B
MGLGKEGAASQSAPLTAADRATLQLWVEEIVPPEVDHRGGWLDGVEAFLDTEWDGLLTWAQAPVRAALDLDPDASGSVGELADELRFSLIRVAHEGFYGAPHLANPPGWRTVGYSPLPDGVVPVEPDPLPAISLGAAAEHYDTIVIGAGTGGGVVAGVLADAGERVLLVERSRQHRGDELRNDHLRGKRAAVYAPTAGPENPADEPRVQVDIDGQETTLYADNLGWGLNAMTVGGGTRLWQGQAWRFLPEDFRMASVYGVPEGSTLVDWPIGYDDMEPWYEVAEHQIGVCGDAAFLRHYRPQASDFPMPPFPKDPRSHALKSAADELGWRSGPLSFAINTRARHGRLACVRCSQCCGHSCPVDAKAGSHNTVLRRAMARPSNTIDLLPRARALRLTTQGSRATGVVIAAEGSTRTINAARVVVSAGAAETPRLLLWSGVGNDHVGRHLQGHSYAIVYGMHPDGFDPWAGPGHSRSTLDFNHHNPGVIGGGVIHDSNQNLPISAATAFPGLSGVPAFGPEHSDFMRNDFPRVVTMMGCGQQIPSQTARVTLDPAVRDNHGVPVVRFSGGAHPADEPMHEYLSSRCSDWLEAMGCTGIVDLGAIMRQYFARSASSGEHGAGTCRMGDDPAESATDRFGRVHGTDNVYVADASLHPTNAGLNPGLTVLANAFRIADHLATPG